MMQSLALLTVQPIPTSVCLVGSWVFIMALGRSLWVMGRSSIAQFKRLHQIPCHDCGFCTDSNHLKCALHPIEAQTEQAINCPDFDPLSPC